MVPLTGWLPVPLPSQIRCMTVPGGPITHFEVSPCKQYLIIARKTGDPQLWHIMSNRIIGTFKGWLWLQNQIEFRCFCRSCCWFECNLVWKWIIYEIHFHSLLQCSAFVIGEFNFDNVSRLNIPCSARLPWTQVMTTSK